ncbi:MAG: hypothetical protein HN445_08670, partial [Bacteroidetes Order II. Incertae sedis bacterium]|nr:hypothetical protein [Bacteroidetes Order II. bacterium]
MKRYVSSLIFLVLLSSCSTDSAPNGMIVDMYPGPDAGNPNSLINYEGTLYMQLSDPDYGSG